MKPLLIIVITGITNSCWMATLVSTFVDPGAFLKGLGVDEDGWS